MLLRVRAGEDAITRDDEKGEERVGIGESTGEEGSLVLESCPVERLLFLLLTSGWGDRIRDCGVLGCDCFCCCLNC